MPEADSLHRLTRKRQFAGDRNRPGLPVSCSIPGYCIDSKRYPLFMARSVMRALIEQLKVEARGVHRP